MTIDWRLILTLLVAWFLLSGATGCKSAPKDGEEWMQTAKVLRAGGFKGRLHMTFGDGHLAGQAFNLSGSHGYLEIEIDPTGRPIEDFDLNPPTSGPVTP